MSGNEFLKLGINITTKLQFIPAVLIGRFAVDHDYDECGNVRNILELAISSVIEEFKVSATRLIVVDTAINLEGFLENVALSKA